MGTYNLLNGSGDRWQGQMEVLAGLQLDVLGLQEAKHWDRDDMARVYDTAWALGMQPLFAPSNNHGCHLVTLYREPRVRCRRFRAHAVSGAFHHTASRAVLSIDGLDIRVLHTHLNPVDGDARLGEARWLTEYAAPKHASLLIGDLNTVGLKCKAPDWTRFPRQLQSRHRLVRADGSYGGLDRRTMAALIKAGFIDPPVQLHEPAQRTAGYWNKAELWDHRSDYVLLSPAMAPALCTYEVVDTETTRALSDHLPVVATLNLDALQDLPRTGVLHPPRREPVAA
ncbi:endonuclease/exonuclease/phosphatase family protein [Streptomyces botrytidirepellens]|uniref:Endonuclease/exonuclease/phosphatase n=1 Tax=Streptomyces botrytidirepellens TaxID=2486417 RepID=A0A3M8W8K3_9ACTN|nr:endonuclease/exonuclease/phosphatase family protein [Streptomyces botrytidirepellens]RNG26254.1 endonuclease/exonuclease/phosphatase [Streptomyces botrytidirepellens]